MTTPPQTPETPTPGNSGPQNSGPQKPGPQKPAVSRSRRGLRIALIGSLVVNVLVIGVLIGGAMRAAHYAPPRPPSDFRALWRAMPEEARSDLRALNRGSHGTRADRQGERGSDRPSERRSERYAERQAERLARAQEANREIIALLRGEPFDTAGFTQVLGAQRQRNHQRLQEAEAAFAQRVSELTPAERQQMAEELERE
ncbi:hypothetical protein [Pararhodobacter oceanensis]|uniref:hypothetical protein n=1 Tax=Pararhodobacter oceanensis TaxID=2172121 RepID=UPI003A90C6A6